MVSCGPKHSTSVLAIGLAETPSTSRITPPTPVLAPPNGSMAEGWLCVSTLKKALVRVIEVDDAGVVHEGRAHPGGGNLLRGRADVGLEEGIDRRVWSVESGG